MTTRDAVRAALFSALWAFLGIFGLALTGWLSDVIAWAGDVNNVVVFPDPRVLVKALVSAVASALIGLIAFVVRYAQSRGVIGGKAPTYATLAPSVQRR